jgi:alginate export protein
MAFQTRTIGHGRWTRGVLVALAMLITVSAASAQTPRANKFFRRQQFLDETTRQRLDADIPVDQPVLFEFGGYIIPQWQQYDDVRKQSNYRQIDLRLWGQLVVDDVHRLYARVRLVHTNFGPNDSPFSWNQDFEGPNLDQGFYELQLTRALQKYCSLDLPADVRVTLGRQFVEFGHGLALSMVVDGGTVDVETGDWHFRGLFANTIRSDSNIDRSLPVEGEMDRVFAGFQIEYLGLSGHQPFVYFLYQRDHTDEKPIPVAQEFDYNSKYLGFGSSGEVVQNLRYLTEAVFEWGHGNNGGAGRENRIKAFAFDQTFEYFFDTPNQPVISVEYALATGDDDRVIATDTVGGNMRGNDNAFLGFGYLNTGYAFAPEFTNLQMLRIGGRMKPLPKMECFRDLEIGVDFYSFWKQKKGGPVSDFRANVGARDLGHEVDLYANWRIFSDLSLMVRYARFWTGDAFANGEKRDYMYAGLIYSF